MSAGLPPAGRAGVEPVGPAPADVRAQLERILAADGFRGSARRRALLRFLVEEAVAGRGDRLKGPTIAIAVFGRDADFDSQTDPVVRLEARRLRRDLDGYYAAEGAGDPVRITIPTGGYHPRFAAHAGEAEAAAPAAPAAAGTRARRLWPVAVLAAAVVLALAGWAWQRLAPPQAGVRGPAVIVLPFEALGSGDDDRFLAGGISQQLITDLMRFEDLRLYSVPASFGQDRGADPAELGQDLSVAYVVKGSVSSGPAAARVNAQLFDARSGEVVWSQTYDRPLTPGDLLALQGELAGDIATALGQPYGVLSSALQRRLAAGTAADMAGYACVQRAYEYRRTFSPDLHGGVLACLEETVRRDPGYAVAWAMLGWLHLDAARYAMVPDAEAPRELARALTFATRAVGVDPSSVVALQALAAVEFHHGNFEESERLQRRVLELNPNNPDALAQLGWRLAVRGRWDEGVAYLERAIDRTISPPGWYFDLIAVHLYLEGRYEEMLPYAERSATGDATGVSLLAIAEGALGHKEAARAIIEKVAEMSPAFARDPAAIYRRFNPVDGIVEPLLQGLRDAGWEPPEGE